MPGKNANMKAKTRNSRLNAFKKRPTGRLNVNLAGRSGWCVSRRQKRQPVETMYDARMATSDSDVMLLSAMVEPILISARRQETTKETMIPCIAW